MITCPFCQATHVANTIFCSECGHYLLKVDNQRTEIVEVGKIDIASDTQMSHQKPASSSMPTQPVILQFMVIQQQRVIETILEHEILIGRTDANSTPFPTVDLSTAGLMAKSVSRRHARVIKRDSEIVLEDLGSINGTFINGEKLTPFLPVTLNTGDKLHFGKISLEVTINSEA